MSRHAIFTGVELLLGACALPAGGQRIPGASGESMAALARGEWPTYAGTYASARYSPLEQVNASNVADLKIAWRWTSRDHAIRAANADIDHCSSRRGAASWRSTCRAANTTGAPQSAAAIFSAVRKLGIEERLGWPSRSFVLVTKTVLLVVQSGFQRNRRPAPFHSVRCMT